MLHLDTRYLPTGGKIVAGISGGPDSLCLLDLLRRTSCTVIVAHLNHQLRQEADQEAALVRERARLWALDFFLEVRDVQAFAFERGVALEEAARELRYRFLFDTARRVQAQAVVVGHTADDQVETILMHFLRGAALDGLKGMQPSTLLPSFDERIPLVRPLLHVWRRETQAYCRSAGLEPVHDPTNADPAYLRNRVRHVLIPELEGYNPRFKQALLRASLALADDHALLQQLVDREWTRAVGSTGPGYVAFREAALAGLPEGMRRNLFRRAIGNLRPAGREAGFEMLQAAAELCASGTRPARLELKNGLSLFRESGLVYLAAWEADLPRAHWPQVGQAFTVCSGVQSLGDGWRLISHLAGRIPGEPLPSDGWSAWLDADSLAADLQVRSRRAGDRFQPLGMATGSQKISDYFIDHKLPRRARQGWPLVCSGETIVWVPGFQPAHACRVKDSTRRVLQLSLEKS
jgi:tRNA(Ile)-lysidine synthase